jgi:hypothetical protein
MKIEVEIDGKKVMREAVMETESALLLNGRSSHRHTRNVLRAKPVLYDGEHLFETLTGGFVIVKGVRNAQ